MKFDIKFAVPSTHVIAAGVTVGGIFLNRFMSDPNAIKWLSTHWFVQYILSSAIIAGPAAMVYLRPSSNNGVPPNNGGKAEK